MALLLLVLVGLSAGCAALSTVSRAAQPEAATSVTVYKKGAMGDVAPVRTIAGPGTGLRFPSAVAVDAHGKQYVANRAANSVTVYDSEARGDAAPLRTIAGTRTGLNLPTGLALDALGDVYVANRSGNTITVYSPIANGNAAPIHSIAGSATRLRPYGLTIESTGEIDVVNQAA